MPVTAVLLAAGYATRLYPLTTHRPKALLPLGDGVMLDAVVRSLDDVKGLRQRFLVTNHRFAAQFRAWQRMRETAVQIIDDGTNSAEERLGAIGDLDLVHRAADPADDLLVVGTDNLFRWSLGTFVATARRHRRSPSIALWRAPSRAAATQFGVVQREASGRISAFVEKSPRPPSADVALCVYYFPAAMRSTLRTFMKSGGNTDAPGYFIEWLSRRGAVYGIMMPGLWYDIGTLEAYKTVIREWSTVSWPMKRAARPVRAASRRASTISRR